MRTAWPIALDAIFSQFCFFFFVFFVQNKFEQIGLTLYVQDSFPLRR